jgi:hypothetical protein
MFPGHAMEASLTDATMRPLPRVRPEVAFIVAVPIGFMLIGLVLRYLAYVAVVPDASFAGFAQGLCRWDCGWYIGIAQHGYDPFPTPKMINAGNWAFFPLTPLVVSALQSVLPGTTIVIATIASLVLALVAAISAWPLLEGDRRAYVLYSAFLLSGPFSVYFTTFYTEVLFVLLTTLAFVALKRSSYLGAAAAGALLSATRIVGVFFVLSIAVQAFIDYRRTGGRLSGFVGWALRRPDLVLAVFLAPAGLFAYMGFLYWRVGDALAFSHVQRAWGRAIDNPVNYIWRGLANFPHEGLIPSVSQQLALAAIAGLLLTAWLCWRRAWPAAVFCLVCLALPLFAGLASMLRFVVGQAPLMLALMSLLARWRWLAIVSLLAFLVADYYFTIGWMTGYLTLV